MEEESGAAPMYYCHMCSLIIRPVVSVEEAKCPHCRTGFVEEMAAGRQPGNAAANRDRAAAEANADAAVPERDDSRWSPVLMDFSAASSGGHGLDGGGDLAAFARRQYRNIALMQLLHALQVQERGAGRERVVLVCPADARAMLAREREGTGLAAGGLTFGDLFLAPGMDLLLEYMSETDTSRQSTTPARKESVAALPTVWVREAASCPVCLDELASSRPATRRERCRASTCSTTGASCRGWRCTARAPSAGTSCPPRIPVAPRAASVAATRGAAPGGIGSRGLFAGCSRKDQTVTPRHHHDDNQNP
jgi:E3 ubiquitin-protein ligase RNF115/126